MVRASRLRHSSFTTISAPQSLRHFSFLSHRAPRKSASKTSPSPTPSSSSSSSSLRSVTLSRVVLAIADRVLCLEELVPKGSFLPCPSGGPKIKLGPLNGPCEPPAPQSLHLNPCATFFPPAPLFFPAPAWLPTSASRLCKLVN